MFLEHFSPILDDVSDPPGHRESERFWRPRWPLRLMQSAIAVHVASSSRQALIMTFLAIKSFLMPLVLF
jgi:hypothetical protein